MKLKPIINDGNFYGYYFECPGCHDAHIIPIPGQWEFNGNVDRPTFTPSILVYESKWDDGSIGQQRCHSLVCDGNIQFLNDCGHSLAGQTVELPNLDEKDWKDVAK